MEGGVAFHHPCHLLPVSVLIPVGERIMEHSSARMKDRSGIEEKASLPFAILSIPIPSP